MMPILGETPTPMPADRPAAPRATWALAAILATVGITQFLAIRNLATLPSAIYGGDLYYQMGCVRSIRATLDPMATCSTSGALPGYLPLYGTLTALLSLFPGIDVQGAMMAGVVLFKMLGVLVIARGIGKLFDEATGLLVAALWYLTHTETIFRYTEFAAAVVVPLFFVTLCWYQLERSTRSAIVLGVTIALAGYAHAVLFIGSVFLFLGLTLLEAFQRGGNTWRAHLASLSFRTAIVVALATLALGYWWKPIFHYHFETSPHYTEWNGGPALETFREQLTYTRAALIGLFATKSTGELIGLATPPWAARVLVPLLMAAGVVVVSLRRRDPAYRAVGTVCGITALYAFHYLVTQNLLGLSFVPEYVRALLWDFARFLLVAATLAWWHASRAATPRGLLVIRASIVAAIVVTGIAGFTATRNEGLRNGRTALHPMWPSLQEFVERNTAPRDVFLSSNELSFALSALTGRRVMVTRRAQNDAFLDMDVRNKDAALILYGNDPELRRRLIRQYGIQYLLWSVEWLPTEFVLDDRGRVVSYADPLLYFENPAFDRELERAGVRFVHQVGWVDPALRGEQYPTFPLTIVTDDNYRGPGAPKHPDIDAMVESVWSYQQNGRMVAALFRIRL